MPALNSSVRPSGSRKYRNRLPDGRCRPGPLTIVTPARCSRHNARPRSSMCGVMKFTWCSALRPRPMPRLWCSGFGKQRRKVIAPSMRSDTLKFSTSVKKRTAAASSAASSTTWPSRSRPGAGATGAPSVATPKSIVVPVCGSLMRSKAPSAPARQATPACCSASARASSAAADSRSNSSRLSPGVPRTSARSHPPLPARRRHRDASEPSTGSRPTTSR